MARLQALGVADDTLVLFLSDNGGCAEFLAEEGWVNSYPDVGPRGKAIVQGNITGLAPGPGTTFQSYETAWSNVSNVPFRLHKTWVHEGGISTPLIAHWPNGISAPGIVHGARHVCDIMPTILDATGARYPKDFDGVGVQRLDGESMIAQFDNTGYAREQPIFWEHEGNCAMRQGDWKLVRAFGSDWELYNMCLDRTELHDLRHANGDRANRMIRDYEDWADKTGVVDWAIIRAHPDMDWVKPERPAG